MKALFIQLSDIHIKNVKDSIFDKKVKLLEAIQNETKSVDEVFLMITGDTSFSGSVEEFELSKTLFDEVIEYLSKYSGKKINTIILPGNHDCQKLSEENKAREGLIKFAQDNGSEAIDQSVVEVLSSVQTNYFDFAKHYNPEPIYTSELLNIYRFEFSGKSLVFYTYNTAFQSILHEQPGKMIYPVSMIYDKQTKPSSQILTLQVSNYRKCAKTK